MAETGCLKDGHFQNLEVESGNIVLSGVIIEPYVLFGMSSLFLAQNFGAPGNLAGHTLDALICPSTQTVILSKYHAVSNLIKSIQSKIDGTVTLEKAEKLLSNIGADTTRTSVNACGTTVGSGWMGTNAAPKNVVVLGGSITGSTASATALNDNTTTAGHQTLILFHEFEMAASAVLTLNHHADAKYKAAGSNIWVSVAAGSSGIHGLEMGGTSASEPADADVDTIITATGAVKILHGSYLYFNCAAAAANGLHVHGVLLTSGGTVALTFA